MVDRPIRSWRVTKQDKFTVEQEELLLIFRNMLAEVSKDGATKRRAGEKPNWRVDPDHEAGFFSHISKWKKGHKRDEHSSAHPLVHAAWRALAIAWQEENGSPVIPASFVQEF